jgi:Rrf2 family iron-sulfur cluster assembly transcriptional regulator
MKITANEEYGLRIMLRAAKIQNERPGELISLNELAQAEGISVENTASILSKLREAGLIESLRGKFGGYKLIKEPAHTSLYEVLKGISKETFSFDFCESYSGTQETCVNAGDCTVRPVWSHLTSLINNFLAGISIKDLMTDEHKTDALLQRFTSASLEGAK